MNVESDGITDGAFGSGPAGTDEKASVPFVVDPSDIAFGSEIRYQQSVVNCIAENKFSGVGGGNDSAAVVLYGIIFLVVMDIHESGLPERTEVVDTADRPGLFPRAVQGRQQQSRQDRNDRDHDQELYQRKTARRFTLQI